MARNLTVGRGELWFARFKEGTQIPEGELYVGNSPEFNLTIESEELEHFDSDHGINELDESIPLSTTRSGSFTTDDINPDNMANFFFGESGVLSVTGASVADEVHDDVEQGRTYQLGVTTLAPSGARMLDDSPAPVVEDDTTPTPTVFVAGEDYTIDLELGRLTVVPGGDIVDGTNLRVTYATLTSNRTQTISGSQPVAGTMRYISFNPVGQRIDYFMPYVKLSPNGDFALKGDEWQTIPFTVQVLKKEGLEAIYMDGRPYV